MTVVDTWIADQKSLNVQDSVILNSMTKVLNRLLNNQDTGSLPDAPPLTDSECDLFVKLVQAKRVYR